MCQVINQSGDMVLGDVYSTIKYNITTSCPTYYMKTVPVNI